MNQDQREEASSAMSDDLDAIIRRSLKDFTEHVFLKDWKGMEREAVSLFAFGFLVPQCQPGTVLSDPAQIGIEVRVLKPGVLGTKPTGPFASKTDRVCKDLVVWAEPGTTWQDGVHPLTVIEWKANEAQVFQGDVKWLAEVSAESAEFTGYAVCLDMKQRTFRLSCTRVKGGTAEPDWFVVEKPI